MTMKVSTLHSLIGATKGSSTPPSKMLQDFRLSERFSRRILCLHPVIRSRRWLLHVQFDKAGKTWRNTFANISDCTIPGSLARIQGKCSEDSWMIFTKSAMRCWIPWNRIAWSVSDTIVSVEAQQWYRNYIKRRIVTATVRFKTWAPLPMLKNTLEHSHRRRHLEGGLTRINWDSWFTGRSWTLHCWGQPLSLGTSSPTAHYWLKDSGVPWQKPLGRFVPGLPRQENGEHSSWESERGAAYLATEHVASRRCFLIPSTWKTGNRLRDYPPGRLKSWPNDPCPPGDRWVATTCWWNACVTWTECWIERSTEGGWKWIESFMVLMANWIWHVFFLWVFHSKLKV